MWFSSFLELIGFFWLDVKLNASQCNWSVQRSLVFPLFLPTARVSWLRKNLIVGSLWNRYNTQRTVDTVLVTIAINRMLHYDYVRQHIHRRFLLFRYLILAKPTACSSYCLQMTTAATQVDSYLPFFLAKLLRLCSLLCICWRHRFVTIASRYTSDSGNPRRAEFSLTAVCLLNL